MTSTSDRSNRLPGNRPEINFNLEALRGLAALIVVWGHVLFHTKQLDPGFTPTGIASYTAPGHFAVLIFFLLSGYVIGITNPDPMQLSGIRPYLRKRFVRLYPIYIIAVLVGVAASGFTVSLGDIGAHLLFLQEILVGTMFANNPLWSLSCEVLFYLLFIPLSLLAVRPWMATLGASVLGVGLVGFNLGGFMGPYLIGFSFWTLGWTLSTMQPSLVSQHWPRILSALLLILGIEYLNPLATVATKAMNWIENHPGSGLDTKALVAYRINVLDYAYLPYAASIILVIAGRGGRIVRGLYVVLLLLPLYGVLYAVRHAQEPRIVAFVIPCLFYLLSLALYFVQGGVLSEASRRVVQALIPLGAISYGLYVIHFPIITLFHRVVAFSGTPLTFAIRAVIFLLISLMAAYILDKKFQPWIRKQIS